VLLQKFGADGHPDRGLHLHFVVCKKDPSRKNSMMAFRFTFSKRAFRYHRKKKTNENGHAAAPSKRKCIIS
jgi:hypothetical protein